MGLSMPRGGNAATYSSRYEGLSGLTWLVNKGGTTALRPFYAEGLFAFLFCC